MTVTEMNRCRNYNCNFHELDNVGCRLKDVYIDTEGKCICCEERESIKKPDDRSINVENVLNLDRKYIRDTLIPEILDILEKGGKIIWHC